MKKIVAFDDLAFYRSKAEIEAQHEFRFSYEGTAYVLDLGDANYGDVRKYFTELANAATILQVEAAKSTRNVGRAGPGASNGGRSTKENKELREWVKANNIMAKSGTPRLAYLTETGKHRYPDWLWSAFDSREEANNGVGRPRSSEPASPARQGAREG